MPYRVRRRHKAVVGTVVTAAALYGAHRAAQRALRGFTGSMLLAPVTADIPAFVPPPVPPIIEIPTGDPYGPGAPGAPETPGWPGLLSYVDDFVKSTFPGQQFDPGQTWHDVASLANDALLDNAAELDLLSEGFSTLLGWFGSAFGAAGDLAGAFIQGAIQYATELLGLATGDQLNKLANNVYAITKQLHLAVLGIKYDLGKLTGTVVGVVTHLNDVDSWVHWAVHQLELKVQTLTYYTYAGFGDVYAKLNAVAVPDLDVIINAPALTTNIVNVLLESPTFIDNLTVDVLQKIDASIDLKVENVVQTLLQTVVLVSLATELQTITQQITDIDKRTKENEECCADTKSRLPDLTGLLLLTGTYPELLAAVEGFLDGAGPGIESALTDWLEI